MGEDRSYQYVVPQTLTRDYEVTPRDLLAGLKQTTSSHGLPHVARARGKMSSKDKHISKQLLLFVFVVGQYNLASTRHWHNADVYLVFNS